MSLVTYDAAMVVTVASFKGGVGKSTTAIHLAGYLESQDNAVVLIDDAPQSQRNVGERQPSLTRRASVRCSSSHH